MFNRAGLCGQVQLSIVRRRQGPQHGRPVGLIAVSRSPTS